MSRYGLIGEHLGHSFSKIIHENISDYQYELIELSKSEVDAFMKARDFTAINVTIPYKETVIPYLDEVDESAREIGAVNTIVNLDGKLYGYNTDFSGMRRLAIKSGINFSGKKILIAGSGGTGKTAMAVAKSLGAGEVVRLSRSGKNGYLTYEEAYEKYSGIPSILINATPCGMYPEITGSAFDLNKLHRVAGVIDAVYNPLRTELVIAAKMKGIKAVGGLYMLVAQAVYASEYFMAKHYDDSIISECYEKLLKEKENIVLIGMPGSGKTTIGRKIAKLLGREFLDSDEEIEKCEKTSVGGIIVMKGENYFRRKESEVICNLSAKSGCVIATGGGAVLKAENVFRLRQNGRIYFLDRPINRITPTDDRPLSSNREKLQALYDERYQIYRQSSDVRVNDIDSIENGAERIINEYTRYKRT